MPASYFCRVHSFVPFPCSTKKLHYNYDCIPFFCHSVVRWPSQQQTTGTGVVFSTIVVVRHIDLPAALFLQPLQYFAHAYEKLEIPSRQATNHLRCGAVGRSAGQTAIGEEGGRLFSVERYSGASAAASQTLWDSNEVWYACWTNGDWLMTEVDLRGIYIYSPSWCLLFSPQCAKILKYQTPNDREKTWLRHALLGSVGDWRYVECRAVGCKLAAFFFLCVSFRLQESTGNTVVLECMAVFYTAGLSGMMFYSGQASRQQAIGSYTCAWPHGGK